MKASRLFPAWNSVPLILVLSVFLASACGQKKPVPDGEPSGPYLGQVPPDATPRLFAPGLVSTGQHELDLTLTPDGREILITRSGPDWFSAILQFRLEGDIWTGPRLPAFSVPGRVSYPFIAPDGGKVYFNWDETEPGRTGQAPDRNIRIALRTEKGWSEGAVAAGRLNTAGVEMYPGAASDGALHFCARYEDTIGGFDLYRSDFKDGVYEPPVNLGPPVNTEANEFHPFITPDGGLLLFDAQRGDGLGRNDIFASFRTAEGGWSEPFNLGPPVNTPYGDMRPRLSPDGKYLFFCSDRPAPPAEPRDRAWTFEDVSRRIDGPGNGSQDIYWVAADVVWRLRPAAENRR